MIRVFKKENERDGEGEGEERGEIERGVRERM